LRYPDDARANPGNRRCGCDCTTLNQTDSDKETGKMTKAEIVERVAVKTGFPKKDSVEMVELLFDLMKDTLQSGEKLKISGFGNFEVKQKSDRRGRNPQTGEEITIEARKILTFKPSNMLKDSINAANG
jgi:integration host factor subunit alpha